MVRFIYIICVTAALLGTTVAWSKSNNESLQGSEKKAPVAKKSKIAAGTRVVMVFPSVPQQLPITQKELALFFGSLNESDNLGVLVADRKQQVLEMDNASGAASNAAKIVEQLSIPPQNSAVDVGMTEITIDESLRQAVAQMSDLEGLVKAVVLVLDEPLSFVPSDRSKLRGADTAAVDTDSTSELTTAVLELSSLLALNNVILFTVYASDVESLPLEQLTVQTGGRNFYLNSRVSLNDTLYLAYDLIVLRTIELAPQKALYDSDEVCAPLDVPPVAAPVPPQGMDAQIPGYVLWLQIASLLAIVCVFLGVIYLGRRGKFNKPSATGQQQTSEEKSSPAFSKLTIGLNRIRNTFGETESKINALAADLDDFGSENWELQKTIVSAYADLAGHLFLLSDHIALKEVAALSEQDQLMHRKFEQIFEDCHIELLVPQKGDKFHSKYHRHAGQKPSNQKAGTVLEITRKGYQRKGFISDEPFVLRQAEVIVSAGNEDMEDNNE